MNNERNILQAVLKVSERCNISCTYCYFFNGADNSYSDHSAIISESSVDEVCLFLRQQIEELDLTYVTVALHGGEPLLMKKQRFESMLEKLSTCSDKVDIEFYLQTNGMLLDEEWIALFSRYKVRVGISLDGNKEINDRHRIDKKQIGTYERSISGLRLVQAAISEGKLPESGILCVINPEVDGGSTYRHFVDDLGVKNLDFLLPDESHDTFNTANSGKYANFLVSVFREWVADNNPNISIRFLEYHLHLLTRNKADRRIQRDYDASKYIVTISSDATIAHDDIFRSMNPKMFTNLLHVSESSISELYLSSDGKQIDAAHKTLPDDCTGCIWSDVCRGGYHLIHRYKEGSLYNNRSVYCHDIDIILGTMVNTMSKAGVLRKERLEEFSGVINDKIVLT